MKIQCACGCTQEIEQYDSYGRQRKYVNGHNNSKERHFKWKGGRIRHSNGYVKLLMKDHPFCDSKGYVMEHRLVMEEFLGRYLTKDEDIHHINGIKTDNRIENLELMTKSEHGKLTRILCSIRRSNK